MNIGNEKYIIEYDETTKRYTIAGRKDMTPEQNEEIKKLVIAHARERARMRREIERQKDIIPTKVKKIIKSFICLFLFYLPIMIVGYQFPHFLDEDFGKRSVILFSLGILLIIIFIIKLYTSITLN